MNKQLKNKLNIPPLNTWNSSLGRNSSPGGNRWSRWSRATGVGNLWPAWTFDMARIRIFFTQFRVQNRVKSKLHDKQVLKIVCHRNLEASIPRSKIKVEF